jgi:hypothetical protein
MKQFGLFLFGASPWRDYDELVHIGLMAWIIPTENGECCEDEIVSLRWPTESFNDNYIKLSRDSSRTIFMETTATLLFMSNGMLVSY